jgi:hypothetical protein
MASTRRDKLLAELEFENDDEPGGQTFRIEIRELVT